ncbi:GNAT family N-acetyltransferase [Paraflavitalea sp. CAU 1676]|uniref:GNAT family N-acetyltransferase n=1 Tax=Paraflavitalea sp. CAU 1676 TaxID=3032598 RepID=UPI0023DA0709|nr:GNAT family N-acetyltransferase [Paraflavitalea sp. CAU 1676]MDF2188996.1 GNAT family N-acetyltransferase [Paraflavitalea sp. CAU 1676]
MSSTIAETERLLVREFNTADSPFVLELLNEPAWLQFIGDKKVRTLDDAVQYIRNVPLKSYRDDGYGLWLVQRKSDQLAIGMCGLIKREALQYEDIGFAYLAAYNGMGYAYEAATAVLEYAKRQLQLKHILAITNKDNTRSIKLLEKLGLTYQRLITMPGEQTPIVLMGAHLHGG